MKAFERGGLNSEERAKRAQELLDSSSEQIKEAARAMERTTRIRRIAVVEQRRHEYKKFF